MSGGSGKFGAFDGGVAADFGVVASTACSPSFPRQIGIFWSEFMALAAMGLFGSFFLSGCHAKFEPIKVLTVLRRNHFGVWQARGSACFKRLSADPNLFGQIMRPIAHAFDYDKNSDPTIKHLLRPSSPAAIVRLIISVIVDAINRMLLAGPGSHVAKERFKVTPLRTNRYASGPVIGIFRIRGAVTALAHRMPTMIERMNGFVTHPETISGCQVMAREKKNSS